MDVQEQDDTVLDIRLPASDAQRRRSTATQQRRRSSLQPLSEAKCSEQISDAIVEKDCEKLLTLFMKCKMMGYDVQQLCTQECQDGKSAVRTAIVKANGDLGVIEFLQRYPVDLNVRHGTNQLSILHLAVNVQDKKILHYLIKNTSVHINATDSKGQTPLHHAIVWGDDKRNKQQSLSIIELLIKHHIDLDKQDIDGKTALHLAVGHLVFHAEKKMRLLCKQRAKVNLQDVDGNTVLHLLLLNKTASSLLSKLQILLKYDVKIDMKNKFGKTAWETYMTRMDESEPDTDQIAEMEDVKRLLYCHTHQKNMSLPISIEANLEFSEEQLRRRSTITNLLEVPASASGRRKSSITFLLRKLALVGQRSNTIAVDKPSRTDDSEGEDNGRNELMSSPERQERARKFGMLMTSQSPHGSKSNSICSSIYTGSEYSWSSIEDCEKSYHSGDDELDGDFEILPSITVTPKPSCSRIAPCSSCLNSPEDKTTAQAPMIRICDHVKGEAILLDTSTTLEDELEVSFDPEGNSFPTESSNAEADGPSLDAVDNVIRVMETEETEVLMTSLDEAFEYRELSPSPLSIDENGNKSMGEECLGDRYSPDGEEPSDPQDSSGVHLNSQASVSSEASEDTMIGSPPDAITPGTSGKLTAANRQGMSVHLARFMECLASLQGRTSFFGKKSGPLNGVDGIYDAQIIHAFQSDTSGQILQLLRDYEPTHLSKVRNEKGETLLHLAVQKGNIELIDALLKRDFPVDEVDIEGASPLHLATKNKVTSVVARLLRADADRELPQYDGETPYSIAITKCHRGLLHMLLRGIKLDADTLELLLHRSTSCSTREMAKIILRHIEQQLEEEPNLHCVVPISARKQHWTTLTLLIQRVTLQNEKGRPKLYLDKRDDWGLAAGHYCAMANNIGLLRQLYDGGAHLLRRSKEEQPRTVRTIAAENGFIEILEFLHEIFMR